MNISVIQTSLCWEQPSVNRENLETIFEKIPKKTQLVVLPEMFTTGFSQQISHAETIDGATVEWLKKWAKQLQAAIAGSVMTEENSLYYNRLYFVHPCGTIDFYDKKHLFSFVGEGDVFSAGRSPVTVSYLGWNIRLFVCYDLRFPKWLRNNQSTNYDVLLGVANWPTARIDAWDCLLKARAIENMCYSVGCNIVGKDGKNIEYNGHSAVYDFFGRPLGFAEDEPSIINVTLNKGDLLTAREKFPVLKDAD